MSTETLPDQQSLTNPVSALATHGQDAALREALVPVQATLRACIDSLPQRATSAGDLAKRLKLDRTAVWWVWQAAYAKTFEECGLRLVGEQAMAKFLTAMERLGADPSIVEGVRLIYPEALARLERIAGDMHTLRLMLSPVIGGNDAADARFARLQHDAARLRLGVQAERGLAMFVRTPSTFENLADVLVISQCVRLQSLRQSGTHVVGRVDLTEHRVNQTDLHRVSYAAEHLGETVDGEIPADAQRGRTLPIGTSLNGRSFWRQAAKDRFLYTCVSGHTTGQQGESTFAWGDVMRAASPAFKFVNWWVAGKEICLPCEQVVIEAYISDEEYQLGSHYVSPMVIDRLYALDPHGGRPLHVPDAGAAIEHYQPGRQRPALDGFSAYPNLSGYVEQTSGACLASMHLFRWRIAVPLVGMAYGIHFHLNEGLRRDGQRWNDVQHTEDLQSQP